MDAVIDSVGGAQIKGRVRFAVVVIRAGEAFAGHPGVCEGRATPVPVEGGYVGSVGRGMRALRAALAEARELGAVGRGWRHVVSVYDPRSDGHVWWPCHLASD